MISRKVGAAPIPIRVNCPECGLLHVDKGKFATTPHHTHSCQGCGMTWRPAVVDTVGVQFLPGFKDEVEIVLCAEEAEAARRSPKVAAMYQRIGEAAGRHVEKHPELFRPRKPGKARSR